MQSSDFQSHQQSLFTSIVAGNALSVSAAPKMTSQHKTCLSRAPQMPAQARSGSQVKMSASSGKSPLISMSLGSSNQIIKNHQSNKQGQITVTQASNSFFKPFPTRVSNISMKMAASGTASEFDNSQYVKMPYCLNEMNAAGAGQQKMRSQRSSVVMQAASTSTEPTVTGEPISDHLKEGFQDMMFYHNQYVTLANVEHYTGNQYVDELMATAKALATPGKGILASDESTGTIGNRFESIGCENTHENRIAYRSLLFNAPEINKYISGAICYDETVRDSDPSGVKFVQLLADKGIIPGIKIDIGMTVIQGTKDETATMGLDGMNERAKEYYAMGIRFAKWRAVIKIDEKTGCPSEQAIRETAHSLARYGSICQHAGLVPIIEPEILTDGSHSIQKCAEVSERVYEAVQSAIVSNQLIQEGLLWKPNMVTQGATCTDETSPEEVAFYTVRTLSRTIPPCVPGITFLSGGQPEETASANLNAINKLAFPKHPWNMSFSFGRALQTSVLKEWKGKPEGVKAAQAALLERCKSNGEAALGKYEGGSGSTASDYVANYRY